MKAEGQAVLLKIKREFTESEAINYLTSKVTELQIEKGILKSELAEAKDNVERIREQGTKTFREWMKDEAFKEVNSQLTILRKKCVKYKKSMKEWREKYFNKINH